MSKYTYRNSDILGIICIIVGIVIAVIAIGDLLFRLLVALTGLSIINYGLRLRRLPPLQILIPLIISRHNRWF